MKHLLTLCLSILALTALMALPIEAQFIQQGSKLAGTGAVGSAYQGASVSLSADGNTAVVGGNFDNSNTGAAWIYTRSGGVWTQQGSKLVGTGAVGSAWQGFSVSLSADGNTVIVGGPTDHSNAGAAWVYTTSGGVWTQQGSKLIGTGAVGIADQGLSVSLSADGNTAIAGGYYDNSNAGATWVYMRSGGVWTQQGSKLVGTGAVGTAHQGYSVSLSADGSTAIVGGPTDHSNAGAAWVFCALGFPVIAAVSDIPNDQGGQVRLRWNKSPYDNPLSSTQVSSYSIFRQSSAGPGMAAKKLRMPEGIAMDSSLLGYDYVATIPAFQLPYYRTVVPTLEDSTSAGTHYYYFRVVAQTTNLNQYYVSGVDSGYSVDNLAPEAVRSIAAQVQAGPSVNVHWGKDFVDPDVCFYEVHRSTTSGFPPSEATKIGQTADTMLVDASPVNGSASYYRIVTADVHGNRSVPSQEARVAMEVTVHYSFNSRWNLVSVPLLVTNYGKTTLFPSAVTDAFAYQGGYSSQATLANGIGYWLKFSSLRSVPMTGLLLTTDTVTVHAGWNLIGSLSSHISVYTITPELSSMTMSYFYAYTVRYIVVDTIAPGKGYWAKVNQPGRLILTSSGRSSLDHITIVPSEELPPPPPDGELSNLEPQVPNQFTLAQNYPNPFNPTTAIQYELPVDSRITLKVYNTVGQTIAILSDAVQSAGYKSVEFDASHLSSGIYFYRLEATSASDPSKSFTEVKKMLLLK